MDHIRPIILLNSLTGTFFTTFLPECALIEWPKYIVLTHFRFVRVPFTQALGVHIPAIYRIRECEAVSVNYFVGISKYNLSK